MAKKSQDSNKTAIGGLSAILIILLVLFAQYVLDIDVLNIEEDDNTSQSSVVDTSVSGDWYDLYFTTPLNTNDRSKHVGAEVEIALLAVINSAQRSIDAALYELNMESLTQAFIAARQRGVRVRFVMDDKDAVEDESSTVSMLEAAGFKVYCKDRRPADYDIRCDDRSSALMHNKFLIIDGSSVWMGSMNFTHNGLYNNNNNAMYIRSSRLAQNYQSEFDEMFIDGIFTRAADQNNMPFRDLTIGGVRVETYFSPEDGLIIERRIAELINGAQTSVYFMTNIVTLESLGTAAINRFNNRVDVKAMFESRGSMGGQMVPMGCAGIPVKQDANPNTFHHKVIIIDGQIVITGSFNFSAGARDSNSENVLIFHSAEIAQAFTNEFFRWFNDPAAPTPNLNCS